MPTVLENDSSSDSFKEFTFTYTNSDSPYLQIKSEYVGYESRKYGVYQTSEDDFEEEKEKSVPDEHAHFNLPLSEDNR